MLIKYHYGENIGMNKQIMKLKDISITLGKNQILDNINLEMNEGEVVGLLGPNGAGKTTLMKCMCRLLVCDSGSIVINGHDIQNKYQEALKHMGVLIEETCAYDRLSGLENLKILARMYDGFDMGKLDDIIEIIGLKDSIKNKFKTYSLGMKKRLGIGMALLNEPDILLLDEPSNGLDIEGQIEIRELILRLVKEKNITILISSHVTGQLEKICNRAVFMKKGKLIAGVNMDELHSQSLEEYYLKVMEGSIGNEQINI